MRAQLENGPLKRAMNRVGASLRLRDHALVRSTTEGPLDLNEVFARADKHLHRWRRNVLHETCAKLP